MMMMMESFVISVLSRRHCDMAGGIVFWVDCDLCGVWVHTYCAFNKNAVSRKFKCKECSS